ncbi:MAG: hypothetical protein IJA26_08265, partial [Clostridia bacterium]|nr:hypothetical protein [Clostridia bacterium]
MTELINTMKLLAELDLNGNIGTISLLLDTAMAQVPQDAAHYTMLKSAKDMLAAGNADPATIIALLDAANAIASMQAPSAAQSQPAVTEAPVIEATEQPASAAEAPSAVVDVAEGLLPEETAVPVAEENLPKLPARQTTLPSYIPSRYATVAVSNSVAMDVPADWGNNASERAVTSYSPVNKSGAISPGAGTLTTTLLPREQGDDESVFDT